MDRIENAVTYHHKGFNCAQAVAVAFSDCYDIEEKTVARLSCAYGGGIGKQGLTCGAVLGMCMLVGLEECKNDNITEAEKRKNCYAVAKSLCDKFKKEYGSIDCKDIIGMNPCSEKVRLAAQIFNDYINDK
ncbi:MAG: C_GCAxxG_C_C family protein [Bacteroidales bacterium]|nr:C_GCAxxG_C_C family protein [Bacteroidales bacterium]